MGKATGGSVRPRDSTLLLSLVAVVVFVACVQPLSSAQLGGWPSFVPVMLALILSFDLLSFLLLTRQFSDTGDRRALVLASSYMFSFVVLAGYGAAFPGVLGAVGPLGGWPSTAPWLYIVWHAGFSLLLAVAVAPWPQRWSASAPVQQRRSAMRLAIAASALVGAIIVAVLATGGSWLPVLIEGTDLTAMTRVTAPVVLPLVAGATVVAVLGALRLSGPTRWASLAAVVVLGDLVLTYFSYHRFTVGWYGGRSMTIVASAVVLVAMLAEFGRLQRRLAAEDVLLRSVLSRSEELEGQHATLLNHMSSGVMLQGHDGSVVAVNPAASSMLGLSADQLQGRIPVPSEWAVLHHDGSNWPTEATPAMVTLRTGEAQRQQIMGIRLPSGHRRWLRVSTSAQRGVVGGDIRYVVSSMTDETERHESHLAATRARDDKRRRVQEILDTGGPQVLVQPIVDLRTGSVVGGEALSRFHALPEQGPDRWFSDACEVGLGTTLELAAVRKALGQCAVLPAGAYLSVNVSPATAATRELFELVTTSGVPASRLVLELTEHTGVANYPALCTALTDLRLLGVRIAVDDAGSGFASLRHILELNPDIVKLDLELVRGIHTDPARRALAAGLLIFAEQIGASLIAEGIENEQELVALRAVGIVYGQGYHLARPSSSPPPATLRVEQVRARSDDSGHPGHHGHARHEAPWPMSEPASVQAAAVAAAQTVAANAAAEVATAAAATAQAAVDAAATAAARAALKASEVAAQVVAAAAATAQDAESEAATAAANEAALRLALTAGYDVAATEVASAALATERAAADAASASAAAAAAATKVAVAVSAVAAAATKAAGDAATRIQRQVVRDIAAAATAVDHATSKRETAAVARDLPADARETAATGTGETQQAAEDRILAAADRAVAALDREEEALCAIAAVARDEAAEARGSTSTTTVEPQPAAQDRLLAAANSAAVDDRERAEPNRRVAQDDVPDCYRDELTGATQRHAGREQLTRAVARAHRLAEPLVVALVALDQLRRVNDAHGHAVRDHVLQTVGAALLEGTRASDVVTRIGGDEFVCAFPGSTLAAVEQRFTVVDGPLSRVKAGATISIGLAQLQEDESLAELIVRADRHMYGERRTSPGRSPVLQ
jgi:diguanylate cyclase (GGDEF)-like protein/PAS domain S-box-containing protein